MPQPTPDTISAAVAIVQSALDARGIQADAEQIVREALASVEPSKRGLASFSGTVREFRACLHFERLAGALR